ncbi:SCO family protein [Pedobacter sp. MW01-1-1]|uniref:SCO family protein n=1 Tax=Pedobacter sp. MW01-1-1 TaxID=3383027 RepID=UPI003FF0CB7E
MKKSPIKKVLILVSILAVPGFLFFYILPQFAKNRYKRLPIFGEKVVASTFHSVKGKKIPDTIYHTVPNFSLVNQTGDSISWNNLKGKIVVVSLFYQASPVNAVNKNLSALVDEYAKNKLIQFLSISVDPSDEGKLNNIASSLHANAAKWNLLSGDSSRTYPLIREGLTLDVLADESKGKTTFVYSNQMVLLDNQHRIRGFYEATNADSMAKLSDEIKVLIAEDLRDIKDGR